MTRPVIFSLLPLVVVVVLLLILSGCQSTQRAAATNRRAPVQRDAATTRFKKSWGEQKRPQQCSNMYFWDFQIGSVSVLGFFDSAWQSSHNQSVMLRELMERMNRNGFDQIQYFVINAARERSLQEAAAYAAESSTTDDDGGGGGAYSYEDEQQQRLASEDPPDFFDRATDALIESLGPDIMFTQDNSYLQIWDTFDVQRDQILILDRCGRLTYEVFAPWSNLEFAYVKAAILSTYHDEPCGYCPIDAYSDYRSQFHQEHYSTSPDVAPSADEDDDDSARMSMAPSDDSLPSATAAVEDTSRAAYSLERINEENRTVIPISENRTADDVIDASAEVQRMELYDSTTSFSASLPDGTREEETTVLTVTEEPEIVDETTLTWWPDKSSDAVTESDVSSGTTEDSTQFESFATTIDADDGFEPSLVNDSFSEIAPTGNAEIINTSEFDALLETDYTSQLPDSEFLTTDIETSTEPIDLTTASYDNSSPQDLQKSRSTNARSVLNELTSFDNLQLITNPDEVDDPETFFKSDFLIPVRIIMRAPHTHKRNDKSAKKKEHEYLVLKTGVPDYHAHLKDDSGSAVTGGPSMDGEQYKYRHDATDRSAYGNDETPGLYGEINDILNRGKGDVEDDNDPVIGNTGSFFEPAVVTSMNKETYEGATPEIENLNYDDIIGDEDKYFMQHYSKIIPWLKYSLDK
ncbi:hypothetical protein TKK_0002662 [Trichogramma kaykai]|uniref:Selenoprotein P N-terminal domain-containing protein n=1 Tax=Trichogramma kaykai TaxID=54128 RepID=A0ABD2XQS2_9HYME